MEKPIQLIVGLGNPGAEYEHTRHNAGVWLLDLLCDDWGVRRKVEKKFRGEFAIVPAGKAAESSLYCLFPTAFMNRSGQSVRAAMQFYKLTAEQILVLHDEIDLPAGTTRLKKGGGHAGHNGLRDIVAQCGSSDFYRLRIGVGHPGEQHLVHDYVLKSPSKAELNQIQSSLMQVLQVIPKILTGDTERAMTQLHTN